MCGVRLGAGFLQRFKSRQKVTIPSPMNRQFCSLRVMHEFHETLF